MIRDSDYSMYMLALFLGTSLDISLFRFTANIFDTPLTFYFLYLIAHGINPEGLGRVPFISLLEGI